MQAFFTTAKPFVGHSGMIQRNAIQCWKRLLPDVGIILFGDKESATETKRELGLRHEEDVNVVTDALGLDTRIGAKYLKSAVSYGGPCFSRDNRVLAALAARVGASSDLADPTDLFNRARIKSLAEIVKSHHWGTDSIGVLGLTSKPNKDAVEESFGLLLAQELSSSLAVLLFDPSADPARIERAQKNPCGSVCSKNASRSAALCCWATPWREFRKIPADQWVRHDRPSTVITTAGAC